MNSYTKQPRKSHQSKALRIASTSILNIAVGAIIMMCNTAVAGTFPGVVCDEKPIPLQPEVSEPYFTICEATRDSTAKFYTTSTPYHLDVHNYWHIPPHATQLSCDSQTDSTHGHWHYYAKYGSEPAFYLCEKPLTRIP